MRNPSYSQEKRGDLSRALLAAFFGLTSGVSLTLAGVNWHKQSDLLQMRAQVRQLDEQRGQSRVTASSVSAVTTPQQIAADLAESLGGSWETVGDTGSMVPALNSGDLAVLLPSDIQNIEVGDIIVYRIPASVDAGSPPVRVVHRVIAKELCASAAKAPSLKGTAECTVLRTQGDANKGPDPVRVRVGDLEGLIVARIDPKTGQIHPLLGGKASSR